MENETPIPAFGPDVAISIIPCISIRGIGPVYITDDIPFMLLPTVLELSIFIDGAVFNQILSRFWKLILMNVYRGLIDSIMFCQHLFNV